MKKCVLLAIALLAMMACDRQGGNYKVIVNLPDETTDGLTAYLTDYDTGDTVVQVPIHDKCAVLEGSVDDSFMARLLVNDKRVELVVESGEISVNWADGIATGSKLNERLNALANELEAIENDGGQASDQAMAVEMQMRDRFYKAYEDNKDNGIGPWAFNYYLMYNEFTAEQLDSIVSAAPERYRSLKRVQKAVNAAKQLVATAVGQKFADFTDAAGVKLSDFAGKGKYTLVDFWASWCGPCRREIPNIKGLYDKYKDKMNFVGVAVWDKPDDTAKAIESLQIPWTVLQGGQNWTEPTDLYGINGIPHIMLIDPDGVIVARQLSGQFLVKAVEDLKL